MKLKFTVNNKVATAEVYDNESTKDFIKQLPLDVTMDDLYNREKYVKLSRSLTTGQTNSSFRKGDIAYWIPGSAIALCYAGNHTISQLMPIGKFENNGEDIFHTPGSVKVQIEVVK